MYGEAKLGRKMQNEKCWLIGLGRSGTIQLLCIRSDYCFIVQLDCCSVFILIFGSFSTLFCIYPLSKLYVLRFFTAWVLISLLAFCEEVSAICAHDFDILLFLMRYFCQLCNLFVFWPFVFFFNLRVGAKPVLGGPARTVHGLAQPGPGRKAEVWDGPGFFFKRLPDVGFFFAQCVPPHKKNRWFKNAFLRPAQCSTSGWQNMFWYYYYFLYKKMFPPKKHVFFSKPNPVRSLSQRTPNVSKRSSLPSVRCLLRETSFQ